MTMLDANGDRHVVKMPTITDGELLIVKVGSDERPAGNKDIKNVATILKTVQEDPNLTIFSHHCLQFERLPPIGKDQMLIVRIGSEERPAEDGDIEQAIRFFKKAKENGARTLVVHHCMDFEIVSRLAFDNGEIAAFITGE